MDGPGRTAPSARALLVCLAIVLAAAAVPAASRLEAAAFGAVPPPTPGPNGSPSPFPTLLHTPGPPLGPPDLRAPMAILEDLDSGQVLLARDARRRHPIASLTKIMTANLALRAADPADVVRVSEAAAGTPGSSLGLRPGERIAVGELLYGLLLQSSNDAAVALAEKVGGTVSGFVRLMNDRAGALGLRDTRFHSPSGLDDRGYSSARDLAALARHVLRLPAFDRIVRTRFRQIPGPSGRTRRVQNRNALLWLYPGAFGVKTGFTTPAGHCLVGAARRGSRSLVAVVLGEPGEQAMFDDAARMLNFGFAGFLRRRVVTRGDHSGELALGGEQVPVAPVADLYRLVRREPRPTLTRSIEPTPGIRPPLAAGERVGRLVVRADGRLLGAVAVAATVPIPAPSSPGGSAGPLRPAPAALPALLRLLAALLRLLLG